MPPEGSLRRSLGNQGEDELGQRCRGRRGRVWWETDKSSNELFFYMYEKKAFRVTSQKQINQIKNNKGEIIETQKKNKNPRNLSLDNKHVIVCDFLCVYRSL